MSHPVCVALDFETSGYYRHSACSIGLARLENGELVEEFYSLIKPPSSDIRFTHIHGLRWSDLKDAENFATVWKTCAEFISGAQYLVAHNATFDRSVLYACCDYYDCQRPEQPFLCTLKASRQLLPISAHNLNVVCDYFGLELDHHNALSDARACGRILLKFLKRGAELSRILI